ncbi:MAG TPA: hemerythrin domain-containing protein [Candidatus Saccharimonadales bacterium]|nr:hemerythrin domain-containing protein [Candidatus Saccharimonadales bacterium]
MTPDGPAESPFGVAIHRQLKMVHLMLRNDLALCRELASDVAAGALSDEIFQRIASLKTRSPIWTLRVNCLYHCRVVHAHYHAEDVEMFPALRRSNPELSAVVDKLESDHRVISQRLDEVEATDTPDLDGTGATAARERLVRALGDLADLLLTHLAFEEEAVAPAMRAWASWPKT